MTRLRWSPVLFRPYLGLGTSKEKKRKYEHGTIENISFFFPH